MLPCLDSPGVAKYGGCNGELAKAIFSSIFLYGRQCGVNIRFYGKEKSGTISEAPEEAQHPSHDIEGHVVEDSI